MMLALDTSGPWISGAVGNHGVVRARYTETSRLRHNEGCRRLIRTMVADLGEPLEALAVNTGPGSFTGTRVGVSLAMGYAQARSVVAVPVSLFEVVADLAPTDCAELNVAIPITASTWCLARMTRDSGVWTERSTQEVDAIELKAASERCPLYIPWGDLAIGIRPPANWCPAESVLHVALELPRSRSVRPGRLAVRYVGASQAERKFRDRRRTGRH